MMTRSGRRASQQPGELARFKEIICGAQSYLEIGARDGDTFYEIVKSLPFGSRAVAVDLPGGKWGTESSADNLLECASALSAMSYDITVIFGDSSDSDIIQTVGDFGPYDAVFIDGDHRYRGVKEDWLNYGDAPIVGFHDIDGEGVFSGSMPVEVPLLWAEIKDTYRHESIIDCVDGRKMGIGVIWR